MGKSYAAVVLIEALVLKRITPVKILPAIGISALLNLISTAVGILYFLSYSSSFLLFIAAFICAGLFRNMCVKVLGIDDKMERKKRKVIDIFLYLFFFGLAILSVFLGVLVMPGHNLFRTPAAYTSHAEFVTAIIAAVLLYLTGFILTVVIEGYFLKRIFLKYADKPLKTAVLMNVPSYIVLFLTSIFYLYKMIPGSF